MAKVREYEPDHFEFFCPACNKIHFFWTRKTKGESEIWHFNNDLENPTVREPIVNDTIETETQRLCSLQITEGQIIYAPECGHDLVGQTVEMEEI